LAILNAEHLLEQAAKLIGAPRSGQRRQVDIRRAISAAYYAVFHATLTAAADAVIGPTRSNSPHYTLAYRSIDHKELRAVCELVRRPTLPPKYRPYCPTAGFGNSMRSFAATVIALQERRNTADYDPSPRLRISDAVEAVDFARVALTNWNAAPADECSAFLMVLMFPPR
jgi:hypothetical protein